MCEWNVTSKATGYRLNTPHSKNNQIKKLLYYNPANEIVSMDDFAKESNSGVEIFISSRRPMIRKRQKALGTRLPHYI